MARGRESGGSMACSGLSRGGLTHMLDSGSSLLPGTQADGPHPGIECQPGQLKQADKGRAVPELKNSQNYLPSGSCSWPLWERTC